MALLTNNHSLGPNFLGINPIPVTVSTTLSPVTHLSHPWVLGSHQARGEELWCNRTG